MADTIHDTSELSDQELLTSGDSISPKPTRRGSSTFQVMIAVAHVYHECGGEPPPRAVAAAVLRATADQIQMKESFGDTDADAGVFAAHQAIHAGLLTIAAELEARPWPWKPQQSPSPGFATARGSLPADGGSIIASS